MTPVGYRTPLAAVFGGGGPLGIAFGRGVADGLVQAGVPLHRAPMIGSSAGAFVAASLAADVPWDTFVAVGPPRVPNPKPGGLHALATRIFADRTAPGVHVTAVQVPMLRRVSFDASSRPVAALLAASAAVPGLFPPALLDRSLYVDGSIAPLVVPGEFADASHLLVVAPMAGDMLGLVGRVGRWSLHLDIARWRRAHPDATVTVITPDWRVEALVRHPLSLFNRTATEAAYPLGLQHAKDALATDPALAVLATRH